MMGLTLYPTLRDTVSYVEPTAELVEAALQAALDAGGGDEIAIHEICYSANELVGSEQDQALFVERTLDWYERNLPPVDYMNWWALEDSPGAEEIFFQFCGLRASTGASRDAFQVWTASTN
jgi:hypothetical protein